MGISKDKDSVICILKEALILVFGDGELLPFLDHEGLNDVSIEGGHDKDERDAKHIAAAIPRSQKSPGVEKHSVDQCRDPSDGHQQFEIPADRCKDDDQEEDEIKIAHHPFRKIHPERNNGGVNQDYGIEQFRV